MDVFVYGASINGYFKGACDGDYDGLPRWLASIAKTPGVVITPFASREEYAAWLEGLRYREKELPLTPTTQPGS